MAHATFGSLTRPSAQTIGSQRKPTGAPRGPAHAPWRVALNRAAVVRTFAHAGFASPARARGLRIQAMAAAHRLDVYPAAHITGSMSATPSAIARCQSDTNVSRNSSRRDNSARQSDMETSDVCCRMCFCTPTALPARPRTPLHAICPRRLPTHREGERDKLARKHSAGATAHPAVTSLASPVRASLIASATAAAAAAAAGIILGRASANHDNHTREREQRGRRPCGGCGGEGTVECFCVRWDYSSASSKSGLDGRTRQTSVTSSCDTCGGSGKVRCPRCRGGGLGADALAPEPILARVIDIVNGKPAER